MNNAKDQPIVAHHRLLASHLRKIVLVAIGKDRRSRHNHDCGAVTSPPTGTENADPPPREFRACDGCRYRKNTVYDL